VDPAAFIGTWQLPHTNSEAPQIRPGCLLA
jgi:hypothetical protein